jgi:nitroreductase
LSTEKHAETAYPIHELLRARWSPRAFAARPIEREVICSLLEAARWAPSSFNEQPWRFLVARKEDSETLKKLAGCLSEGNRPWAERAPLLILTVAKTYFRDDPAKANRHAFHDVGLATQNLVIQATALGLYVHQMAGFDRAGARELFDIPEGYEPVAVLAVGYLDDPDTLPENLRERELAPRARKPLREIAFAERFGWAFPLEA